jgi:2-phosphoglycerate kinase
LISQDKLGAWYGDPYGTLRYALWIGGGQWAGKSSVARTLAVRYGVTSYHYDYQDARAHDDRRIADRIRAGEPPEGPGEEDRWVNTTPEQMAEDTLAGFPARFEWVLDDLRALFSSRSVIAEGWGLRPELVAPIVDDPRRMVVMVPTDEFRERQMRSLPRAATRRDHLSDPERAYRNRVGRDRLVAEDAVRSARELGITVIEVDGSRNQIQIAKIIAEQWAAYLPEAL